MARLAATDHGADWVINTDADEFWMPRRATLKEMFGSVASNVGIVFALSRHFSWTRVLGYWGAQLLGALAAAALLRASLGNIAHVGATLPSGSDETVVSLSDDARGSSRVRLLPSSTTQTP